MESLSNVVRVYLPNYLRDLPIPTTVFGWFQLGVGDWVKLLPFGTVSAGVTFLAVQGLANSPVLGPYIKVPYQIIYGYIYPNLRQGERTSVFYVLNDEP